MTRLARAWLAVLCLAACAPTRVRVQNDLPEVSIENFRWISASSGRSYALETAQSLAPGELSSEIHITDPDDEGTDGPLHFEIVLAESRIALRTTDVHEASVGETTIIHVRPETAVDNPLADP